MWTSDDRRLIGRKREVGGGKKREGARRGWGEKREGGRRGRGQEEGGELCRLDWRKFRFIRVFYVFSSVR